MREKLSFKEQLRWTLYGLGGYAVPAIYLSNYAGPHQFLAASLGVLVALGIGIITGRNIQRLETESALNKQNILIDHYHELVVELQTELKYREAV